MSEYSSCMYSFYTLGSNYAIFLDTNHSGLKQAATYPRLLAHTVFGVVQVDRVLTENAREFVTFLHRTFAPAWAELEAERIRRQERFRRGNLPARDPGTPYIREGGWQVAPPPPDLKDRRVEIIVAANEANGLAAALESGAQVLIADFDDLFSPTLANVMSGHSNLAAIVQSPRTPALIVRPRGWHLREAHLQVDGAPVLAALFDAGLYLAHSARRLTAMGTGPYLYLPKLESGQEARLWQAVFQESERALGLPQGAIRATVQIETINAAFAMDEILYELRGSITGLNAGRWDYLFNLVKRLGDRPDTLLPDREHLTSAAPFMQAYAERLVRTAHRRGAHAIGGTSTLVPDPADPVAAAQVLTRVRAEKEAEAQAGYDGAWVAHPALVAPAREAFDRHRGGQRADSGQDLLDFHIPGASVTTGGVRANIVAALLYLSAWLGGKGTIVRGGAVEDTATAELARTQLWQWVHHRVTLDDGAPLSPERYRALCDMETASLAPDPRARALLDRLVLSEACPEFFPCEAYSDLIGNGAIAHGHSPVRPERDG